MFTLFQSNTFAFWKNKKKARDGTRTRGLDLGKVALHQLSHSRIYVLLNTNNNILQESLLVNT